MRLKYPSKNFCNIVRVVVFLNLLERIARINGAMRLSLPSIVRLGALERTVVIMALQLCYCYLIPYCSFHAKENCVRCDNVQIHSSACPFSLFAFVRSSQDRSAFILRKGT